MKPGSIILDWCLARVMLKTRVKAALVNSWAPGIVRAARRRTESETGRTGEPDWGRTLGPDWWALSWLDGR